jgi:hypothetical protein
MLTTFSPFQIYSYCEASIQCVNHSCHDMSFPAIPNVPGFHWTKVVWAPATQQLALHALQYVSKYIVINAKFGYEQLILVFLLIFSLALEQTQLVSQLPQPLPPPVEMAP